MLNPCETAGSYYRNFSLAENDFFVAADWFSSSIHLKGIGLTLLTYKNRIRAFKRDEHHSKPLQNENFHQKIFCKFFFKNYSPVVGTRLESAAARS